MSSILDQIFQHRALKADAQHSELRTFTLAFFDFFDSTIIEDSGDKENRLIISLSNDLSEYFGKAALDLTFQSSETVKGRELVAYGSRVFDQMIGYLERYAALTVQQLPSRHAGNEALLQGIRPLNAAIADLKMQQQIQHLYLFNWQIVYRADDKREELYTVVLDEDGKRLTIAESADGQLGNMATEPSEPSDASPPLTLNLGLNLNQLLSDAEPPALLHDPDGQPLPLRLPPMTHLTRLAEDARKYAIYHADLRSVAHEADILPRLHKTLDRLTNYYNQQIEEVYDAHDPDGEKRLILQQDLERKIAEEVENHRLRVEVELFSYAILQMPIATADIMLSDGRQEVPIHVQHNCYNQALQRPACANCGKEVKGIVLCRDGQISCESCMQQCGSCQDVLCDVGAVSPCPLCEQGNCDRCGQMCWACGERACEEHLSDCPICQDPVCHGCQVECAHCQVRQCRSHLQIDCVLATQSVDLGQSSQESHLICRECAVRCPNCHQYSAHVESCSVTGQRFCENCMVECADCAKNLGLSSAHINPENQLTYCADCLSACPACGALTSAIHPCDTCQNDCCASCGGICTLTGKRLCINHLYKYSDCGHIIAIDCQADCAIGHEPVCPSCEQPCEICERYYCEEHTTPCRRCELRYCSECVRRSGLCDTCATIGQAGEPIDLTEDPCATHPEVAQLIPRYRWFSASSPRHSFYFGTNALMSSALIVVENTEAGPEVRLAKKLGMVEMIRGKARR